MDILSDDLSFTEDLDITEFDPLIDHIADESIYFACIPNGCNSFGQQLYKPYKIGLKFENMTSEEYPYDPFIEKDTLDWIDNNKESEEE